MGNPAMNVCSFPVNLWVNNEALPYQIFSLLGYRQPTIYKPHRWERIPKGEGQDFIELNAQSVDQRIDATSADMEKLVLESLQVGPFLF